MERSREIEAFMGELYDAMVRGDAGRFDQVVSGGDAPLAIGSDPEEWWSGQETILAAFRGQLEATGGFPVRAGAVRG